MKLKHLSILLSFTGITVLYFISTLTQPSFINISEISKYEGKKVTIEGTVVEHYLTKYNSQMITIADDNNTVKVFSEEQTTVEYGDRICVTGEVQKFENTWEIIANNKQGIIIIQKWQNISIPLWQIAQSPERYEGLNVNITGYIDSVFGNYFYLSDEEGKHALFIDHSLSEEDKTYLGQRVDVCGLFEYDKENLRYILILYAIDHKITPDIGER